MTDYQLNYSGRAVENFEELVKAYGISEFKSHTRSTVPFLQFWRNPEKKLKEVTDSIGFSLDGASNIYDFEHRVPVRKGKGKASHSDLKIISNNYSFTIEGKYLESRYQTCKNWLKDTTSPENKRKVLEGWIELLNSSASNHIKFNDVQELPYQIIHRAASACHETKPKQILIYQVFDADEWKQKMYIDDLKKLSELIGNNTRLGIYYMDCKIENTSIWDDLSEKWKAGKRDLSDVTIGALKDNRLVETEFSRIIPVK